MIVSIKKKVQLNIFMLFFDVPRTYTCLLLSHEEETVKICFFRHIR